MFQENQGYTKKPCLKEKEKKKKQINKQPPQRGGGGQKTKLGDAEGLDDTEFKSQSIFYNKRGEKEGRY